MKIKILRFAASKPIALTFLLIFALGIFLYAIAGLADPYPPLWGGGSGAAVHYKPSAWPSDAEWNGYTSQQATINDPRVNDPSDGGAQPQNYVNVSSGCPDQSLPSVYWSFSNSTGILYYRWRVEQIANNYATGPSAGPYSSVNPWGAALWTVLFDTEGDGFRNMAAHLDGSSGSPSASIDRIASIYGADSSHVIDYIQSPLANLIAHNPTGFVNSATDEIILNFQNTNTPTINWPSGSLTDFWDYGSTRLVDITNSSCEEYFVDYQIPIGMLNASAFGGPAITPNTPISMFFATANSLNDPFQKDMVYGGDLVADVYSCVPYGDFITLDGGLIKQPIVDSVTSSAGECGPATLTARVRDALVAPCTDTISTVHFYFYYDRNADGLANDGSTWTYAAAATVDAKFPNLWTASWDSSSQARGQYLIGVKATDNQGNINESYLSSPSVVSAFNFVNPSPEPGPVNDTFLNYCGAPPILISKLVGTSPAPTSSAVAFTLIINNPTASPVNINAVSDSLPLGFTYISTDLVNSTLPNPTASPTAGSSGTIAWTYSPDYAMPGDTVTPIINTLVFLVNTASAEGTYYNVGFANTSEGDIESEPAEIVLGAPALSLTKIANTSSSSPGDTIQYTLTYSNPSPGGVTNTVVRDAVPSGLTYVPGSASGGGIESGGTITWYLGDVASGDGPFDVTFEATVDDPYPTAASRKNKNTGIINSNDTTDLTASATVYVDAAGIGIIKNGSSTVVTPGGAVNTVSFYLTYENSSKVTMTNGVVVDYIPQGFIYNTSLNGGVFNSVYNTVTWGVGTVPVGFKNTVTVTLQAANYDGPNPATNIANISTNESPDSSDSFVVGLALNNCVTAVSGLDNSASADGWDVTRVQTQESTPGSNFICANNPGACDDLAPTIGPVYNEDLFQDMYFSTNYIPSGYVINGAMVRYVYVEKNMTERRVDARYQSTSALIATNTAPASTQNKSQQTTMDVFSYGVDTPSEINDLKFRALVRKDTGTGSYNFGSEYVELCVQAVKLVIDKMVDLLSASPGNTLTYTINYSNPGTMNATGVYIEDTLPNGTTFVDATLNGALKAADAISGSTYKFFVNSSGVIGNTVANKGSGSLVIRALVNSPLEKGISTLTNYALINSTLTSPVSDTAATSVIIPDMAISKIANTSMLYEGESAQYTIRVLNTGFGNATNVTVQDTLPVLAYYVYNSGSANPAYGSYISNTMTWTLPLVMAGTSNDITFKMDAIPTVPSGITNTVNYASISNVTEITGTYTSDPVVVKLVARPNLYMTKSIAETGPLSPGDTITYTITVNNIGSEDALDVRVTDTIPANTTYTAGTLIFEASSQTDVNDGDSAYYDAVNSRVVFEPGTVASGLAVTMKFEVTVNAGIPSGTTTIDNIAYATASNASQKQASASIDAQAAPTLNVVKSAPEALAYPLTLMKANAVNTNTISVDTSAYILGADVIYVGGSLANVLSVSGSTVQLDANVTANQGDPVTPTFNYILWYINSGDAASASTKLWDTMPQGITYISSTGGGTFSAVTNTVTWDLGTLDPGEQGLVTFLARPIAGGDYLNIAYINAAGVSNSTDSAPTSLGVLAPSKVTNTPSVTNTKAGTTAKYIIYVRNQSASIANDITVTDTLPAGFAYDTTNAIYNGGAPLSYPSAGDAVPVWGIGNLASGGTLVIDFTATVSNTVGTGTYDNALISNSANVDTLLFDELATTAEDVTVSINTADISVSKTVDNSTAHRDMVIAYTITATNLNSTYAAENIVLQDVLPYGITYNSSSATSGSYSNTTGFWTVGDIAASGNASLTLTAFVNTGQGSTITNCAKLYATFTTDGNSANNEDCEDITPTLAFLSDFQGYSNGGKPTVQWETRAQPNTMGFNLFRLDTKTGEYTQVSRALLPALVTAPHGATYSFVDETAASGGDYSYILEEVESYGKRQTFGPFALAFYEDGVMSDASDFRPNRIQPSHPGSGIIMKRKEQKVRVVQAPETVYALLRSGEERGAGAAASATVNEVVFLYFDDDGTIVVTDRSPGSAEKKYAYDKHFTPDGTLVVSAGPGGGGQRGIMPGAAAFAAGRPIAARRGVTVAEAGTASPYASVPVGTAEDIRSIASGLAGKTSPSSAGFASTGTTSTTATTGTTATASETSETVSYDSATSVQVASSTSRTVSVALSYAASESATITLDYSALSTEDISGTYSSTALGDEDATGSERLSTAKKESSQSKEKKDKRVGSLLKIHVKEDGIYYMGASEMAEKLGLTEDDTRALLKGGKITLTSQGSTVALIPDEGYDGVFFYGQAEDGIFTNTNVYWLYNDKGSEMRTVEGDGPAEQASASASYAYTLDVEQNVWAYNVALDEPLEDYWLWDYTYSLYAGYDSKDFAFTAQGVSGSGGTAALRVVGLGGYVDTSGSSSTPDTRIKVSVNGTKVGEIWWNGTDVVENDLSFAQSLLNEGENTITVESPNDTTGGYSYFYIDRFAVTYARTFSAVEDSLEFSNEASELVTVRGFTAEDVIVMDTTDPLDPVYQAAVTVQAESDGTYSASFIPEGADRQYIAVSGSALHENESVKEFDVWADDESSLADAGNRADYVVITTDEFSDEAEDLAKLRSGLGHETMVVLLEDIMDEFNHGVYSPGAVKDFLYQAHTAWSLAPKYVVLLGDGTYDYMDYLGKGGNPIPPVMVETPYGRYPSDTYLADGDGNGIPEVAIGRIPVVTAEEAAAYIKKLSSYEAQAGWDGTVMFVADDPDDGGDFTAISDAMAAIVPDGFTVEKVYLENLSNSEAHDAIMESLGGAGVSYLNYIGHGTQESLTNEGILQRSSWPEWYGRDDVSGLTNAPRLPVVAAMSCFVGAYAFPGYSSLAEYLVTEEDGGAIAVWAPSGMTFAAMSSVLDQAFVTSRYSDGAKVLGDAMLAAFEDYGSRAGALPYVMHIYNLMGDPALRMK